MSKIDDLKTKLSKLEASAHFDSLLPKNSGWLSRKLIVALAAIAALIIIGRDNQAAIINWVGILAGIYIVTQALHDIFSGRDDRIARCALIAAMAKDGFSEEELKVLAGGVPTPAAPAAPAP